MNYNYTVEQFKKSVDLCNARSVIYEEYNQYREYTDLKLLTLDEYKDKYFDAHCPTGTLLFLSSLVVVYPAINWIFPAFEKLQEKNWPPEFAYMAAAVTTFLLIPVIFAVIFAPLYNLCCSGEYKKYENMLKEYQEALPEITALRDDAKARLDRMSAYMRNDDNCIIPEKYWWVANELYSLIKNKRATDIVSAINLYETIQHQRRLEEKATESLAYNEMAAYAAEQAKINSAAAAKKASEAAFYSKVNLAYTFLNDSKD